MKTDTTYKISDKLAASSAALAAAEEVRSSVQAKLAAFGARREDLRRREAEVRSGVAASNDKDLARFRRALVEIRADEEVLKIQEESSIAASAAATQGCLDVGRDWRAAKHEYVTEVTAELADEYMATAGQLVSIARKLIACRLFGGAHSVRLDLSSPLVDHPLVDGRGLRVCASGDHGERIAELRADPEAGPLIAILDELATTERQTELLKRQAEAEREQRRLDGAAARKAG